MDKKTQINLWYALLALLAVLMFQNWWSGVREVEVIPYSKFEELLKAGDIAEVKVLQDRVEGRLKKPTPEGKERFVSTRVDPKLAEHLNQFGVEYTVDTPEDKKAYWQAGETMGEGGGSAAVRAGSGPCPGRHI